MAANEDRDQKLARLKAQVTDLKARRGDVAAPEAPPASSQVSSQASSPVAAATAVPEKVAAAKRSGLLSALIRLLQPKPPPPPPAPAAEPGEKPCFTVVVAALANDADATAHAALVKVLEARPALIVKPLPRVFTLETLEDPGLLASVAMNTRQAVAGEDADLLIWGEVGKDGYRLRFASAANSDDDRAAAFGPTTRIELPLAWAEAADNLLYAAILAAAEISNDVQRKAVKRLLPAAASMVEPYAAKPPVQLSMPQQRTIQLLFGHAAAATAQVLPVAESKPWFDKAVAAYQQAQRRLGRTDPPWEAGLIHKHMAMVLSARAEGEKEAQPLWEQAVAEWRSAAEILTRATMPQEWAAAQVKLGMALYRLDLLSGQTELLREALQVLQGALQVYSRTETPQRWADVMHAIAQVLEVYGDQLRNPEVLQRAIDASRSVLEVRNRERTPLAWAATQNTLGGALFMLDRHTEGASHLAEAELALSQALEVFQAHGAKGPARVAAKNLIHVRRLAEERRGRQVIIPHWADDDEPPPPASAPTTPARRRR